METFRRILGEDAEPTSLARLALGGTLTLAGQYEEAEQLLIQARDFFDAWLPTKHFYRGLPRLLLARLFEHGVERGFAQAHLAWQVNRVDFLHQIAKEQQN